MSVLIKGMEMPFTCWACEFGHIVNCAQWKNHAVEIVLDKDTKRHPNCPLVPIPPHGRLIDADALHEELYALEYVRENEWLDGVREARGVDAARVALLDAPTIIEAEEGET